MMTIKKRSIAPELRRIFALTFSLLIFNDPIYATTFSSRSIHERVSDASMIVRATIGEGKAAWQTDPDGKRRIYTDTPIQITEIIKGEPLNGPLQIREIGGEADGVGLSVSGSASFRPDEDVVLLVSEISAPSGSSGILTARLQSMSMGKLTIERNGDGEEILTGPALPEGVIKLSEFKKIVASRLNSAPNAPLAKTLAATDSLQNNAPPPSESLPVEKSRVTLVLGVLAFVGLGGMLLVRRRRRNQKS